jgi:hypothetical protein
MQTDLSRVCIQHFLNQHLPPYTMKFTTAIVVSFACATVQALPIPVSQSLTC